MTSLDAVIVGFTEEEAAIIRGTVQPRTTGCIRWFTDVRLAARFITENHFMDVVFVAPSIGDTPATSGVDAAVVLGEATPFPVFVIPNLDGFWNREEAGGRDFVSFEGLDPESIAFVWDEIAEYLAPIEQLQVSAPA